MFVVNYCSLNLFKKKEKINIFRKLFHILFAPLVFIGYALVSVYGLFQSVLVGKKSCDHRPAKKQDLNLEDSYHLLK